MVRRLKLISIQSMEKHCLLEKHSINISYYPDDDDDDDDDDDNDHYWPNHGDCYDYCSLDCYDYCSQLSWEPTGPGPQFQAPPNTKFLMNSVCPVVKPKQPHYASTLGSIWISMSPGPKERGPRKGINDPSSRSKSHLPSGPVSTWINTHGF